MTEIDGKHQKRRPSRARAPYPKLTPERQRAFCEAVRRGNTFSAAAALAGLHRTTVHRWIELGRDQSLPRTDPLAKFADAVDIATAQFEDDIVTVIRNAADQGDWRAGVAIASRRNPDEWGEKTQIKATISHPRYGPLAEQFTTRGYDLDLLTDDEADTLIGLLEKMQIRDDNRPLELVSATG